MTDARIIETTVNQVSAELQRRGLNPHDTVTITIRPEEDLLTRARNESRALVVAAGLTDEDIDRMIDQAGAEVAARIAMRIVIDTNILVSAVLKPSSVPYLAVQLVHHNDTLLKSAMTEEELRRVLARPAFAPYLRASADAWVNQVMQSAELVSVTQRVAACRDAADDKFLELALAGRADLVISGDDDLLSMTPFENIPIVTAAAFVGARRT